MKAFDFGKSVILGDSYSTFIDYVPRDYCLYYTPGRLGVDRVEDTWWGMLMDRGEMTLVFNSSYSGSTVGGITYEGRLAGEASFVRRMQKDLLHLDFDTIFVFGCTNDSWADSPVGVLKYEDLTGEDFMSTLPSFGYLMHTLHVTHPKARVVVLINNGLKDSLVQGQIEAAERYGASYILLKDIDKVDGHPTKTGMGQIHDQLVAHFAPGV